jgi:hypothetical protein
MVGVTHEYGMLACGRLASNNGRLAVVFLVLMAFVCCSAVKKPTNKQRKQTIMVLGKFKLIFADGCVKLLQSIVVKKMNHAPADKAYCSRQFYYAYRNKAKIGTLLMCQ